MKHVFIVNFLGKASSTTIKHLAAITHNNDGKWLISKVNFIDDQVAGVIKIELPEENVSVVKEAFFACQDLIVKFVESQSPIEREDMVFKVRLDAGDRAGIVNEVTSILDSQAISILDMDCQRVFIANGVGVSASLFSAAMALKLPSELNIEDIANELESLSEDTRVMVAS
ncbi:transcriptional regulator [Vibrio azureus]|uniref:Glycine cleavage system transcriptional repressor n=1 Tax=Vibrio azureus NBRC 104587 TaxID=1219077 RepID=U3C1I8_9VIBR|nr:ACT domain-containing protein [Vibrio azureus]AUI86365.1 transcriptional regulator [Vibrio azureus]GAD75339.1 hypothetical protein VAZ01S_024_00210 [Vibrio azureus NBRC 104587]